MDPTAFEIQQLRGFLEPKAATVIRAVDRWHIVGILGTDLPTPLAFEALAGGAVPANF